jgi:hypothetical protein
LSCPGSWYLRPDIHDWDVSPFLSFEHPTELAPYFTTMFYLFATPMRATQIGGHKRFCGQVFTQNIGAAHIEMH